MSQFESKEKERDGFKVKRNTFAQPSNGFSLDPSTKRRMTICNLFVNHKLSIADIMRILDEAYGRVVVVLLEHGVIQDRRKRERELAKPGRTLLRKH